MRRRAASRVRSIGRLVPVGPSLHRAVPVKFFHFVPAKSFRQSPASGSRSCPGACTAWPPQSQRAAELRRPRPLLFTLLSDKFVKFLWFVVRDSCVERLFVCTSASLLIMISSHWCAPPSRCRKTRALWLPSSRSSGRCRGPRFVGHLPASSSSERDRPRSWRCWSR